MDLFGLVLSDPNALWARTILLICYGGLILYLVAIEVFKNKISNSSHKNFWELHLASLPVVALSALMYRIYSSVDHDQPGPQSALVLSMVMHLGLMLILLVGCIIDKARQEKKNNQI